MALSRNLTAEQKRARHRVYEVRYRKKHRRRIAKRCKVYHAQNKARENAKGRVRMANRREAYCLEQAGRPKPARCECCGDPAKLVFDHDHVSGKFRGWICQHCNHALGHVRDDPLRLTKLITYLARLSTEL